MRPRLLALLSACALVIASAAAPALAHHGWGGQGTETFTLTGKVHKPVNLSGPHATMQVVDKNGQVWDITLAPPARTDRAGLKADTLKVGDEVTIVGKRNKDAKRFEVKTERVTFAGRNYDVYPDRI